MSKRDIETVCCLAAHLAQRTYAVQEETGDRRDIPCSDASRCAADAMKLQRLGRRARNLHANGRGDAKARAWMQKIEREATETLRPYGCTPVILNAGVGILDFPPNTNLEGAFVI